MGVVAASAQSGAAGETAMVDGYVAALRGIITVPGELQPDELRAVIATRTRRPPTDDEVKGYLMGVRVGVRVRLELGL